MMKRVLAALVVTAVGVVASASGQVKAEPPVRQPKDERDAWGDIARTVCEVNGFLEAMDEEPKFKAFRATSAEHSWYEAYDAVLAAGGMREDSPPGLAAIGHEILAKFEGTRSLARRLDKIDGKTTSKPRLRADTGMSTNELFVPAGRIAAFNTARMMVAWGDEVRFEKLLRTNAAIEQFVRSDLSLWTHFCASMSQQTTLEEMLDAQLGRPFLEAKFVNPLLEELKGPAWTEVIDGQRAETVRVIAWAYERGTLNDVLPARSRGDVTTWAKQSASEAELAEVMRAIRPLFDSSAAEEAAVRTKWDAVVQRLESVPFKAEFSPVAMAMGGAKNIVDQERDVRTLRGAIMTVLAISAYRSHAGKLPATLNELVPEFLSSVPRDWWRTDGGPLTYRVDPNERMGWVLYGVGRDGVDDQGKPDLQKNGKCRRCGLEPGTDSVYTYKKPL